MASLNSDTSSGSIGPYRLLRQLAQGGLGQVYLGESPDGRLVAIKVLPPAVAGAAESRSVLAREARAVAQVDSPFTVRLVDADTDGPVPWLASEYIAGPTLTERVARTGPLSAQLLVTLAAALAEGLADIHAAGLIHRDLKPSNVILADNQPRIVDFGLATTQESASITEPGLLVGTLAYMSPEQIRGLEAPGPASDIFSLGGVLTFAAAGKTPFHGGSFPEIAQRLLFDEPDLVGVPEVLRPLIASCLAKDPAQRPTANDLGEGAYALAERQLGLNEAAVRRLMGAIAESRDTHLPAFEPEPEGPTGAVAPPALLLPGGKYSEVL